MEDKEIIESTVEQLMETVERYYDNEEEHRADIAQVLSSFADKITQNKDMEVFPAKQGGRMTPIEGKILLAARKYALANNTEYGQIIEDMVLNAFRYTYKEYIKQYEEIKILKASEQAALRSQKESFEEQDKIIQELKKELVAEIKLRYDREKDLSYQYQITREQSYEIEELKKENLILLKQNVNFPRLKGEFLGTLRGIVCWDIPEDLEEKLKVKIKELEENNLE